jgi:hypothetical protein
MHKKIIILLKWVNTNNNKYELNGSISIEHWTFFNQYEGIIWPFNHTFNKLIWIYFNMFGISRQRYLVYGNFLTCM